MKQLKDIITEKLRLTKHIQSYKYLPKTRDELRKILEERLSEDKKC